MDLEQEGNHGPLQHHRPVPCPAADIFAYLADFATVAEWDPGVKSAHLLGGEPGRTGARYLVKAGFLGRTLPLST